MTPSPPLPRHWRRHWCTVTLTTQVAYFHFRVMQTTCCRFSACKSLISSSLVCRGWAILRTTVAPRAGLLHRPDCRARSGFYSRTRTSWCWAFCSSSLLSLSSKLVTSNNNTWTDCIFVDVLDSLYLLHVLSYADTTISDAVVVGRLETMANLYTHERFVTSFQSYLMGMVWACYQYILKREQRMQADTATSDVISADSTSVSTFSIV